MRKRYKVFIFYSNKINFHFFCIEILKKVHRINSKNNSKEKIDIYHEAGEVYRSMGNYDEAIKYFNLELNESQSADLHDDILYCHRFLGECYLYKNEFSTSEKYQLNFLSLAKEYANDERIEQAYTCLANTYWLWLSYLQDDILYDWEYDRLPRDLCKKSLDAAENSLWIINKLDYQLEIDVKEKKVMKIKQQDLALRRVRSYINIGNKNFMNKKKTIRLFI
jgi:tetratricopeptide (TPR) repeat protein